MRAAIVASTGALMQIATEADLAWVRADIPHDVVLITAKENPLGPCSEACSAMASLGAEACRYEFRLPQELVKHVCGGN